MTTDARARIRLNALQHNLAHVQQLATGCKVMAAIKGNAYGHGLTTVAEQFAAADSLAIARLNEAEALRRHGITARLVLLGGVSDARELKRAIACDVEWVLHNPAQIELLNHCADRPQSIWLKIDSGMHRLGVDPALAAGLIDQLQSNPAVRTLGLMTHLATADDPSDPLNDVQESVFRSLCEGFAGDVSIANSPALFGEGSGSGDSRVWCNDGDVWVRPGIALYGISPFPGRRGTDLGLQPVMQFETRLIDVKPVRAGERVGYGGRWQASTDTTIGIIAAGYGDGYSRFLPSGTPVLINGRRAPLAGTVSMDLAAVDLGPDATDRCGDAVTLWGDGLPVEEIAEQAGTIGYQLVTGVLHREAPVPE